MQAVGLTEQERAKAVDLVRKGKSIEDVRTIFAHVEADYFDRNEEDLLILAGKKKAPKGHWTLPPEPPEQPKQPADKKPDPLA